MLPRGRPMSTRNIYCNFFNKIFTKTLKSEDIEICRSIRILIFLFSWPFVILIMTYPWRKQHIFVHCWKSIKATYLLSISMTKWIKRRKEDQVCADLCVNIVNAVKDVVRRTREKFILCRCFKHLHAGFNITLRKNTPEVILQAHSFRHPHIWPCCHCMTIQWRNWDLEDTHGQFTDATKQLKPKLWEMIENYPHLQIDSNSIE